MTEFIRGFLGSLGGRNAGGHSDFSDFFAKPAGDKAKVIRQVLREANEEQRRVIAEYRKQTKSA